MDEQIRTIIRQHGALAVNTKPLNENDNLYLMGMTSMASVAVMLALEGHFDIEFPDHMLKRQVFESIAAIRTAITELTNAS